MAVPNRGPELLAVNIAFVTTAVSACLLRCYVRLRMVKAFGLDDWLMVIATVSEAPLRQAVTRLSNMLFSSSS